MCILLKHITTTIKKLQSSLDEKEERKKIHLKYFSTHMSRNKKKYCDSTFSLNIILTLVCLLKSAQKKRYNIKKERDMKSCVLNAGHRKAPTVLIISYVLIIY